MKTKTLQFGKDNEFELNIDGDSTKLWVKKNARKFEVRFESPERCYKILCLLIQNPNQLFSGEDLKQRLTDENASQTASKIRKALYENGSLEKPKYNKDCHYIKSSRRGFWWGGLEITEINPIEETLIKDIASNSTNQTDEIDNSRPKYVGYDFGPEYDEYMKDIHLHLDRINDAEKDPNWKNSIWKVALASILLKREKRINNETGKEESIIIVDVKIPDNPYVAYNVSTRNYIEGHGKDSKASHPAREEIQKFMDGEINEVLNFPARFSQGGSLTVLWLPKGDIYQKFPDDESKYKLPSLEDYGDFEPFVLVARKGVTETIHGKYLRASSGLAEYPETDWTEPRLVIVTECFQKLKISDIDNDKVRYIPTSIKGFDLSERDVEARIDETILIKLKYLREEEANLEEDQDHCGAWYESLGSDEISISYGGKGHGPINGCIALDSKYGAVDLMGSINLRIMKPLSKLKTYDDENKVKKIKRQSVFVFTIDEFANLFRGKKATMNAYGYEERKWREGDRGTILPVAPINPPLFWSGLALLKKFGITLSEKDLKKAKAAFRENLEDRDSKLRIIFD